METLFKALKSSGFDIEATHVADQKRLERLFLLTMIAFLWCYRIGDYLDQHIQKIKLKTHGRRAISVFKYGLDFLSKRLITGFNVLEINMFAFLSCTWHIFTSANKVDDQRVIRRNPSLAGFKGHRTL